MLKKERGVTLITLVITIIVMSIIAGVTTYSGIETVKNANKTAFISEMEIVQAKVNTIHEKMNSSNSDLEFYNSIGHPLTVVNQSQLNVSLGGTSQDGFKYFGENDLKRLGINDINREVLINYNTREVVSLLGFEIDGNVYYKLKDLPGYSGYNVEYTNKNTKTPTFSVTKKKETNGSYTFTLTNIVYNNNVSGGTVSYKAHNDTNWILNGTDLSFVVEKPGLYDIKFTDKAGNSSIVTDYIYVQDGLVLYLDGENNTGSGHSNTTTVWKDLSGNGNDATLKDFNNTDESGWKDNSLKFDGVNDSCVIADSESMKPISQTIDIVLNKKAEAQHKGDGRVIYFVRWVGYTMEMGTKYTYGRSSTTPYLTSNTEVATNKIRSIVATHANKLSKMYINGKYDNQQSAEPTYSGMNETTIGKYSTANCLNGNIYAIRMYNRELSEQEIKINYEIDKYRFNIQE